MTKPHNDYGVTHATRIAALRTALQHGVTAAARMHGFSAGSLYNWRKRYSVADVMARRA